MLNITLKQLRYFEALRLHEHFGRAADACAVTQPALSVQIKELEQTLGLALFERSARHVRLTSFGETVAERVSDILRSIDELSDVARAAEAGLSGRLRVGIIPTIAPYLLPTLIPNLRGAFPDLEGQFRETQTPRLVQELQDGRLDCAIVALPLLEAGIEELPLFDETFLLVRSEREAGTPVPRVEALGRENLLLLEDGHCFRDQAMAFCKVQSSEPREGLDGSSLSTLVQMVGAGIGMTLIPEMAARVEARAAPISLSRFEGRVPGRSIGLVWRKTSPLADQFRELAQVVKTAGLDAVDEAECQ